MGVRVLLSLFHPPHISLPSLTHSPALVMLDARNGAQALFCKWHYSFSSTQPSPSTVNKHCSDNCTSPCAHSPTFSHNYGQIIHYCNPKNIKIRYLHAFPLKKCIVWDIKGKMVICESRGRRCLAARMWQLRIILLTFHTHTRSSISEVIKFQRLQNSWCWSIPVLLQSHKSKIYTLFPFQNAYYSKCM